MKLTLEETVFKKFAIHVLPGIIKPLRVLWNEIIAFVFFVLAVMMGVSLYRNFGDKAEPLPVIGGSLFIALLMYFGVTSYLRARRISKS